MSFLRRTKDKQKRTKLFLSKRTAPAMLNQHGGFHADKKRRLLAESLQEIEEEAVNEANAQEEE